MPRVSAIVPCYNTAKYLRAALDSVIAQTYGDWEIVLVDDGSTDNTPAIAAEYKQRLGDKLQYIRQENRGLPAARNTAIRNARGEFLAILDADDIWLPERLARGLTLMDARPQVGLVHSRIAFIDSDGAVIDLPDQKGVRLAGCVAHEIFTRRLNLPCPSVLIRRTALDAAGQFDESMRATEDRDLWFRIALRWFVGYLDEVLAYYRVSPGSMSSDRSRMLQAQRAFANKHFRHKAVSWSWLRQSLASVDREMADALLAKGRPASAIVWYLRALANFPFQGGTYYRLLRCFAWPWRREMRELGIPDRRQSTVSK